jgi:hypothetical protein
MHAAKFQQGFMCREMSQGNTTNKNNETFIHSQKNYKNPLPRILYFPQTHKPQFIQYSQDQLTQSSSNTVNNNPPARSSYNFYKLNT